MAKRANPRAVKANLTYTIEEAADCLGVSTGTVRTWAKNGLPILKAQRPFLITGFTLRAFLEKQRQNRKMPMAIDELYCLKCRGPQKIMGAMADYVPGNGKSGRLIGLCNTCESVNHRFVSPSKIPELQDHLEISVRGGEHD